MPPTGHLIAAVLAVAAVTDLVIGYFVLRPRVPVERQPVILGAVGAGAFLMMALAAGFWTGLIPLL